jgi:hypothetical protein
VRNRLTQTLISALAVLIFLPPAAAQSPIRHEFTRLVAHWAQYGDPEFLRFVSEAQPEIAQHGFYGGHFWSLAHTEQYAGYPAHFPVRGLPECGDWFKQRNADLHERGVKVVGHFNVEFLVGDPHSPDGPRGFFKFYREHWDERLLGKRPVDDPLELLERNKAGEPIRQNAYRIGGMSEYWACLRNPAWQRVLKAWVRVGIERGLDGFVANYFYRHDCHCEHCQSGFREYLSRRFSKQELRDKFSITDVATHEFSEIVAWHSPRESTELRREMLRWSQLSNKKVFDDVFIRHGRALKPDLIVAQWNHLGNFGQISGDERCLLPADAWGRDEDYTWYSTGGAANSTDLEKRNLGEATLQARYVRGAFDDKPFVLGKYENTRIRTAIAELAANGGAPMGFYARYTDPEARVELIRYYQFLRRFDELYRANRPHAEVALLFPRSAVHRGDVDSVARFRALGKEMLDEHVLFDVLPDDAPAKDLKSYSRVISIDDGVKSLPDKRSRLDAPFTVRVSVSRPVGGNELTLHLVNYNRTEPPKDRNGRPSAGRGIRDEQPIEAPPIAADLMLPTGATVKSVEMISPEWKKPVVLSFTQADDRIRFKTPAFLVYGVVRLRLR